MTAAQATSTKLYTPRLLSLSAELANYPLTGSFDHMGEARSRTCGSTIELGVSLDGDGRLKRIGMQVTACAIGQSSAAIMARSADDRYAADFAEALAAIEVWLSGKGDIPQWPGFDAIEPALPHAGRHGALLLPWKAMNSALSSRSS